MHLFAFYFGIMADVTPPVGLPAFAAAAISRENPIATGLQGAVYSLHTAILPFVFVFNPEILLIGIQSWAHLVWVVLTCSAAVLLFAAASMNWFIAKSRLWESAVLLVCCFALFRPGWWLDPFYPAAVETPANELLARVARAPPGDRITMVVEGVTVEGATARKTVSVPLGEAGDRLRAAGLAVTSAGDKVTITHVGFGSYAKRLGLETGYEVVAVLQPAKRPSDVIPAAIALLAAGGIAGWQFARSRKAALAPATT